MVRRPRDRQRQLHGHDRAAGGARSRTQPGEVVPVQGGGRQQGRRVQPQHRDQAPPLQVQEPGPQHRQGILQVGEGQPAGHLADQGN